MASRVPASAMMLLAAVLLAAPACADQTTETVTTKWKTADQCAKDAFAKYPDYTAQAKTQRDAMRDECLRNHDLPAAAPAPGRNP